MVKPQNEAEFTTIIGLFLNSFNEIIFPSILSKLKSKKSEFAGEVMLIKKVISIILKFLLIIPNFFKKITH